MENIFQKEEQVIIKAEALLNLHKIETENDALYYKALLDEYRELLKQFVMLIKISDLNQWELSSLSKRLGIASNIDDLTGLYNRRYFNETYQKEWLSAVRSRSLLAAIMIDIDFFKEYNDLYGHLRGDECLKSVSESIQKSVKRPRDIVARFGGDEFIVLLPDSDTDGAVHVAEIIITNIRRLDIEHSDSMFSKNVTVSIGIAAMIPGKDDIASTLLNMSDKAVYHAKRDGRNCYRVYR